MNDGLTSATMPLSRETRAYFAPFDREQNAPAVFDPALDGAFALDTPPAPWFALGPVLDLQRAAETRHDHAAAGPRGETRASWRGPATARVEFEFARWGKLQMALAGGAQHLNLLEADPNATPRPSGAVPLGSTAVLPGSTASQIVVGSGVAAYFAIGDLVAVDVDYGGETGYVGTGIAAAYVKSAADVGSDPHFIRRVTLNVARVLDVTATALFLERPLLGGAPVIGGGVQRVVGFVDREGASFFQDWSALFVVAAESGGRILYYYPHLRALCGPAEKDLRIAQTFHSPRLHAGFTALPHRDPSDSEPVVCYRSYLPPRAALI